MIALHEQLEKQRKDADLTQAELSDFIDISSRQIARFESGSYHVPKWYPLALAGLFGKSQATGKPVEAKVEAVLNLPTPENPPPRPMPARVPGDDKPKDDTGIPAFLRRDASTQPQTFGLGAKPEYLK